MIPACITTRDHYLTRGPRLGAKQIISYYLNHCWPIYLTPYGVTMPWWVNCTVCCQCYMDFNFSGFTLDDTFSFNNQLDVTRVNFSEWVTFSWSAISAYSLLSTLGTMKSPYSTGSCVATSSHFWANVVSVSLRMRSVNQLRSSSLIRRSWKTRCSSWYHRRSKSGKA